MEKENIIIVGGGEAGKELLGELIKKKNGFELYNIKGFIDDDPNKINSSIGGLPVLGNIESIPDILKKERIKTVFIAIPSGTGSLMRRIIKNCQNQKVKIKIVPRISEIITGLVNIEKVREINIEDLLGRSIVRQDFSEAEKKAKGKTMMVFGAAGSIGSRLCEQIINLAPERLVCVDWWENGTFYLQHRLEKIRRNSKKRNFVKIDYVIGNIQDPIKIDKIINLYKPHVVFNAAAYKHVPLMEENPSEAVKNNVLGTKNLLAASIKNEVENFILISTDKAVNPTNIMGATKRVTEKLMHYYSKKGVKTSFSAVRFGNVLNSDGSVIPTFKKQIEEGVITVTHKDIVRYFMTIDEAVQLIIQCWAMGKNDEIFILDMGEPMKIIDLAKWMIRLSGKEPGKDVKIKLTGLRPGEKLYEEMLTKIEKTSITKNEKIYILNKDESFNHEEFIRKTEELIEKCKKQELRNEEIQRRLKELVPTYNKNHEKK